MQKKAFDKIQNLFLTKTLSNLTLYGNLLNVIKDLYRKPIDNIRNIECFSTMTGKKERMSALLLFNIILAVLFNVIMKIKRN